jgi:Domain of unknown function (DUF4136)
MRTLLVLPGVLALGLAVPSVAAGVKVVHDPATDFSHFKSYAWNDSECLTAAVPEIQAAIARAIERELESKGLHKVALPEADLEVVMFAIGETLAGATGNFYRNPSWGWAYISSDVRMVKRGALVIDLRDPHDGRPLWHAVAEKTVSNPDKAVGLVDQVIAKAFRSYPPPASGKE